jgi:hypothetical protein
MLVQWCIKGIPKPTDSEAREIFVTSGLKCKLDCPNRHG